MEKQNAELRQAEVKEGQTFLFKKDNYTFIKVYEVTETEVEFRVSHSKFASRGSKESWYKFSQEFEIITNLEYMQRAVAMGLWQFERANSQGNAVASYVDYLPEVQKLDEVVLSLVLSTLDFVHETLDAINSLNDEGEDDEDTSDTIQEN